LSGRRAFGFRKPRFANGRIRRLVRRRRDDDGFVLAGTKMRRS
jgi:hypothetical protein